MPNKDDNNRKGLFNRLNRSMNSLYTTTYYSPPGNANVLNNLRDKINNNIDNIVNQNMDMIGTPSVSRLYSRMKFDLDSKFNGPGSKGSINTVFDNAIGYDDFFASFQSNRYLVEMDAEIDSTCKYFPELEEAIMVMKEGVLSPDYFSKDYLSMTCPAYSGEKQDTFNEMAKDLKKRYNLLSFIEDVYYHTSKYGEDFIYVVPYSTALSRLLTQKPNTTMANVRIEHEAAGDYREEVPVSETFTLSIGKDGFKITDKANKVVQGFSDSKPTVYSESVSVDKSTGKEVVSTSHPLLAADESYKIDIEISRKGIIESKVEEARKSYRARNFMESASEEFFNEADLKVVRKDKKSGKLVIDGVEDDVKDDLTANDGLVSNSPFNTTTKEVKVDVPGCVVSRVRREQVIPIYIGENNTCLGYYYIELRSYEDLEDFRGLNYIMSDTLTSLRGSNSGMNAPFNCVDPSRQEEMLKYVAGQISQFIDKEFVQANQDLREEIYAILKYNDTFNTPAIDKIKISFVPPEDMIHVYFKLDPITHRGISDLDKSMVPAKIYASMYITDAIGKLVRGQDKRVFYVKQTVDSNIAQTLMNVINQVKQGNFGFRQFSNINNVLNITGKFNDFFIPVGASGDSPIDIQTIPGQQFTDNSDQMQQLKEMAVNATGVPFEIIQTRLSVDYAAQLSMSNSKFLRKVYARQSIFAPYLSRLCTKLFNYEYKEKCEIEVILPPPVFINTANTNQLVDNTKNFVNSIAEVELVNGETDEQKAEYIKQLFYFYVGTHIDISRHEAILKKAMQNVESRKNSGQEDNGY